MSEHTRRSTLLVSILIAIALLSASCTRAEAAQVTRIIGYDFREDADRSGNSNGVTSRREKRQYLDDLAAEFDRLWCDDQARSTMQVLGLSPKQKRKIRSMSKPTECPLAEPPNDAAPEIIEAFSRQYYFEHYEEATEAQWDCVDFIATHESGWIVQWTKLKSTAWGLFQFLAATRAHYGLEVGDGVVKQLVAGLQYMKDRYGSPCEAQAFWERNRWY